MAIPDDIAFLTLDDFPWATALGITAIAQREPQGMIPRGAGTLTPEPAFGSCRRFGNMRRSESMGAVFEHPVDVRWRDVDALGHVNHAVFLTYLEEGRDAFYSEILRGDPLYVVARIEIDLRAEVRYPDRRVTVRIEAERLGKTSLTTRETILTPPKEVAARARVVTVRWDPDQRKPIPFSEAERTQLTAAIAG
jgi:acyl-CoA thioester hydrolase